MRKLVYPLLVVLLLSGLAACGKDKVKEEEVPKKDTATESLSENASDYPQLSEDVAANEALVVMNTTLGSVKIKLFPEAAPKTVENFLTHAEDGYYDDLIFHRVINDFMIQGGDPDGTGGGGESIFGPSFEDEFSNKLFNLRGALSMANAGPNTNGSQFFIVQNSSVADASLNQEKEFKYPEIIKETYLELGGTPHLDQAHTVFGQVIEGMDVVDKIAQEEAVNDRPVNDVKIESIEIVQQPTK